MSIKKLILVLFLSMFSLTNSLMCGKKINQFANLSHEVILLIIEQHCNEKDAFGIYINIPQGVKILRLLEKRFNQLTLDIIRIVRRRIIREQFPLLSQDTVTFLVETKILEGQLNEIFKKAKVQKLKKVENIRVQDLEYSENLESETLNDEDLAYKAVQLLIANGSKINEIKIDTFSPVGHPIRVSILNCIARAHLSSRLIPLLVVYGVDINEADIIGNTALHLATSESNLTMIKMLCAYGADVNKINSQEKTPLLYAAEKLIGFEKEEDETSYIDKCFDMLRILLDYNTNSECKDRVLEVLADYKGENPRLMVISSAAEARILNLQNTIPDPFLENLMKQFFAHLNN